MSGWWFAAFAASATRFANAMAALKPLNTYVFVSALPSRRQPEPPSRSAFRARSSSRFSLSGSTTGRAYRVRHSYGARWRCVILCSLRKLCEPTAGGTRRSAGDLSRKSGRRPTTAGVLAQAGTERTFYMPDILVVGLVALVAGLMGFGFALLLRRSFALASETAARANSVRLVAEARAKQKEIILEAKDEAL